MVNLGGQFMCLGGVCESTSQILGKWPGYPHGTTSAGVHRFGLCIIGCVNVHHRVQIEEEGNEWQ